MLLKYVSTIKVQSILFHSVDGFSAGRGQAREERSDESQFEHLGLRDKTAAPKPRKF